MAEPKPLGGVNHMTRSQVEVALQRGRDARVGLSLPPGLDDTKPMVLVLGWWGADDVQVEEYTKMLNEWGYPTVRAVCPRWQVVAPVESPRRNFAELLLEFLGAVGFPRGHRPLVVYALGNGGALPAEKLDFLLAQDPRYQNLRFLGTIFDSGPGYLTAARSQTAVAAQPLAMRLLTPVFGVAAWVVDTLLRRQAVAERFWENMKRLRLGDSSLYLYSQDDPLCDPGRLEALVEERRKMGMDVAVRKWPAGRHVHLLHDHGEEYKTEVRRFLEGLEQRWAAQAGGATTGGGGQAAGGEQASGGGGAAALK